MRHESVHGSVIMTQSLRMCSLASSDERQTAAEPQITGIA